MSILEYLDESLASDAPAYIEFLYRYNPKKKQVFAFYEGDEDASYYHQILEKNIDLDCELEEIVAGCKNNVLKLNREFNWDEYNKNQIVFFVDRDLSFWLEEDSDYNSNVFVTDYYSVENYIVTADAFRILLQMHKGFARAHKREIDIMVETFVDLNERFSSSMIDVMACAIVAKRHNKTIHLDDYKISKHFNFNITASKINIVISTVEACFEKWNLSPEHQSEISKQIQFIKENIAHYSVRGKWSLFFMAELGEFMRVNADHFAPSLTSGKKISATCSFASTQCLPALAPYCNKTIPQRLQHFISSTYGVFCAPTA